MHKVKSHTTVAQGNPLYHILGNDCADHHAKAGAQAHSIDEAEYSRIKKVDYEARRIQNRILAIIEQHPRSTTNTTRHNNTTKPPTTTSKLQELGHQIETRNTQQANYHCLLCNQTWSHKIAQAVIQRGHCPGPVSWGLSNWGGPWQYPSGHQVLVGTKASHHTHNLYWYKGITFCMRCGHFTTHRAKTKLVRLEQPCPDQVKSRVYRRHTLDGVYQDKPAMLHLDKWPCEDNDPTGVPGLAKQTPGASQLTPSRKSARQCYRMIDHPPQHATISPTFITPLIKPPTHSVGSKGATQPTTAHKSPQSQLELLSTQEAIEYDLHIPQRGACQVDYSAPRFTAHIPGYNHAQACPLPSATADSTLPSAPADRREAMSSQDAVELHS